jgi:hypothetical protein
MEYLVELGHKFLQNVENTFLVAVNPNHRLFAVYLLTSVIITYVIYRRSKLRMISEEETFLRFLFPKKVWSHPSAWLDLRYFFFHSFFGKFLII